MKPSPKSFSLAFVLVILATTSAIAQRSWDGGNGTLLWSDPGNWSPDGAVLTNEAIQIGNLASAANDTTLYDVTTQIGSLTLSNGADVDTNGNELIVNGLTTLGDAGTSLILRVNSEGAALDSFDTNELIINSGGLVNMQGGRLEIDTNQLQINAGGTISGNGNVDLDQVVGVGIQLFENSGTLTATSTAGIADPFGLTAATLSLNQTGVNGVIDLDGDSELGVININRNDTLDVNGSVTDAFSGTLNLADGAKLDMSGPWSLSGAIINVNTGGIIFGSAGSAAEITGGQFTMNSGTITLDTPNVDTLKLSSVFVANGGTITNNNEIIFNNTATIGSTVDFQMNNNASKITVSDGVTVTINDEDFNLDGNENAGNITTIGLGGRLNVNLNNALADDSLGHTINLNGGTLSMTNAADALPWTLNSFGTINAAGGATSTITGDAVDISGHINVTANSTLLVPVTAEYLSSANVVIDAGSTLNHNGIVTFNGGSYTGAGTFRKGAATIAAATTWNVAKVDLDDGSTTLNANLTINADTVEPDGDGVDSTITIADATQLAVNLSGGASWTLDSGGIINYNGNAVADTYLSGSDLAMNGTINHVGDGRTNARLDIGSTGVVNIQTAGQPLRLNGGNNTTNPNTISGGTISGPGILGADSGRALHGFGTISADIDFDGAANLKADNGILSITVGTAIVDVDTIGTADTDGILAVGSPWNTNVAATVRLNGGELRGAPITNDNATGINGFGLVSAAVNNNSRINAEGGTLIVETPANINEWDGIANTGLLRASSGNLEIRDNAAFLFNGAVQANAGFDVYANGFQLQFAPASTLTLNGGRFRSTHATNFGGTINVGAGTAEISLAGTARLEATSVSNLVGTLRLTSPTTQVDSGAAFAGGGTLLNTAGKNLQLQDGANVAVLVENQGTLVIGSAAAAQATGLEYQQDATGSWKVDLNGLALAQYDRYTLTGAAQLAGTLGLNLGYVPAAGDTFNILSAAGGVTGAFSSVLQPVGLPSGLLFKVKYLPTLVQLTAVNFLAGDYNENGVVDAADYILWRNTLGTAVVEYSSADGNGNGIVDGPDFDVWSSHFGATAGAGAGALVAIAVPEPSSALLLVIGIMLLGRNRRRWSM
jgi:hypothetical protein